jgi:hypothetical protein
MKTVIKLQPDGGWSGFARGQELADFAYSFTSDLGWHRISPTTHVEFYTSPFSKGCVYLEEVDGSVIEFIVYPPESKDEAFDVVIAEFMNRFILTA